MNSSSADVWRARTLDDLIHRGELVLGRGTVISKIDLANLPGDFPVYSSSASETGMIGRYGRYMFDEELITWSVDGGGKPFYRPRHKFSVTNVCGFLRIKNSKAWDYRFVAAVMSQQHQSLSFDWQLKAHPSVIRHLYRIPQIPLSQQVRIADMLDTVDDQCRSTDLITAKLRSTRAALASSLLGVQDDGSWSEAWPLLPLGELVRGIDAGKSPDCPDEPAAPGKWGVLKVSAVGSEHFRPQENKMIPPRTTVDPRFAVRVGDVLVTRANTPELVGMACIVDRPFSSQLALCDKTWRINVSDRIDRDFLVYVLRAPASRRYIQSVATGTSGSMKNFSQSSLLKMLVPVPTLAHQRHTASRISALNARIDAEMLVAEKLRRLKSGLMGDLLSGRVRIPQESGS
jgi:restriction endonuclease S subunit